MFTCSSGFPCVHPVTAVFLSVSIPFHQINCFRVEYFFVIYMYYHSWKYTCTYIYSVILHGVLISVWCVLVSFRIISWFTLCFWFIFTPLFCEREKRTDIGTVGLASSYSWPTEQWPQSVFSNPLLRKKKSCDIPLPLLPSPQIIRPYGTKKYIIMWYNLVHRAELGDHFFICFT